MFKGMPRSHLAACARIYSVRFLRISTYFLVSLLIATPSLAQERKTKELPPSAYQLVSVTVTGSDRCKPEDVMAATSMQIGQTVHEDDFKDAARVLTDSGAFSDVGYKFEFSPQGTKLEWQVKDATDFVPARFENFVWFSDQALFDAIHSRVPLFHGEVPVRGHMADQVSEALHVLLSEKAIPGSVDYVAMGPDNGPVREVVYSDSGPDIAIRNVEFSGASPTELPLLQAAAKDLQGAPYVRSRLHTKAERIFLPIYHQRGFLKATISEPVAKVVSTDGDDITVDTTFTVEPGRQYQLSAIDISGNKALSADKLRSLIHTTLNQPANAVELDNDIAAMKKLYAKDGYVAASIEPQPQIDDANSTVRYILNISEGSVYKMGELEIHGLDDHTTSRLQNSWTLRPGDVYDSSYAQRFLDQTYKEIGNWRVRVDETKNQDHTVDVTLRFDSKSELP